MVLLARASARLDFRVAAWTGLLSIATSIALVMLFPPRMGPLPDGMRTPILAFELARTRDEIETMFGAAAGPEREVWRHAMNAGNYADFAFMVIYGLFFFSFARALAAVSEHRSLRFAPYLAVLAPVMDVLENLQLLAITDSLGGDYAGALSRLQLFTWCKWIPIAILYACWIPALWGRGAVGRVGALLATLTALTTALALAMRGAAAELMALGSGLTVIAAVVVAFQHAKPTAV
jgi:hypothetical protein